MRPNRSNSGFTLIEAMMATAILSIAVLGLTLPLAAGLQNQQEDARKTLAITLAQDMIEEVLSRSFTENWGGHGREVWESRHGVYNCMNDYATLDEAQGKITNAAGAVIDEPAAVGLSRHTRVTYFDLGGGGNNNAASIVVEIKYHDQPVVTLTRLFYNQS